MATVMNLLGRQFHGYRAVALPHELDSVVESVVNAYLWAAADQRRATLELIRPPAAGVLSAYGQRAAALAVRQGSELALRQGIVAMGMAERRLSDPRDNLYGLVATDHSATLLGTSLIRLIEAQREYLPPEAYTSFVAFAGRDAADRSLRSMGLAAYGSAADFRYGSGPTT